VAYNAEINVSVKNLNQVTDLETKLSSISRNVNALNRGAGGGGGRRGGGGGGSDKSELSEEQKLIQLENKRLRIQNQGLGVTRKALDLELKGQKLAEATNNLAQVETLTEQDQLDLAKNKILLADQEVKKKGLLLKAEQAINAEVSKGQQIKSTGLTAGDRVGLLGLSGKANKLAGKAEGVIDTDRLRNAKLLPSTKMLDPGIRGIEILDKEVRNLGKVSKITGKNVQFLASQYGPQEPGIFQAPQGPFSRLSDRQSRDVTGRRTRLNNPLGSIASRLGATRGFDAGSALISGGFPLLFGQGPGVAAAGALGGGIGGMFGQMGGFAGGIAATAAVQSIQNAINSIGELGKAMNRLNPNISAMSQAMGISGTMEEKRLQLIEKNRGKQAAFNEALEMMGEKIGADRAEELRKFGETFQELGNKVTLFFTKVQAKIAELLNMALDKGADANLRSRARGLVAENPNNVAFREINQKIENIQNRDAQGASANKRKSKDLADAKAEKLEIAESLILQKDKDKSRVETNKLITAGLGDLEKENELNKAILAGKEKEFLIQEAIKSKAEEIGVVFEELEPGQQKRIEDAVKLNQKLEKQVELTKDVGTNFEIIGESIASGVSDNLTAAIMQTKTLGDAAKAILNDLANTLVRLGVNTILKGMSPGIFGSLPVLNFARGGRPPTGRASLVGERGPELFVPRRSGTIIPNDKLGGGNTNINVNVDASGSSVEGDEQQGKELGRVISVAIQSELLKQRRPGGLLR